MRSVECDNILFFTIKGSTKTNTRILGSDTGAINTMITEGILGTAAAMKNIQPISNIHTIDERHTILKVKINNSDTFIVFQKGDLYDYLLERIPEKEQSFIEMKSPKMSKTLYYKGLHKPIKRYKKSCIALQNRGPQVRILSPLPHKSL